MPSSRSPGRQRLALFVAAAVTLITSCLVVVPAMAAAPVLLSQGKPATASSSEVAASPRPPPSTATPAPAGPARSATRSGSRSTSARPPRISQVVLNWEAAYGNGVPDPDLDQRRPPGRRSTPPPTGTGGTQTLDRHRHRPLRADVRHRAGHPVRLLAVGVPGLRHGVPATTPPDPDTHAHADRDPRPRWGQCCCPTASPVGLDVPERPATAADCIPARAFDSDPATRWATSSTTGWVDPGWIYVDLGATAQIKQVVLQWDPAYARAYQIQVSTGREHLDADLLHHHRHRLQADPDRHRHRPLRAHVRHRPRATAYGYSLWEFQVYGTGGAPITPPPLPRRPGRSRRPAGVERRVQRRRRHQARRGQVEARDRHRASTTSCSTTPTTTTPAWTAPAAWSSRRASRSPPGSARPLSGGTACQYTSHGINTCDKFSFTYGRVEARIKVAEGARASGRRSGCWAPTSSTRPALAVQRRDRHHGARRQGHRTRSTPPSTRRPTTAAAGTAAVHDRRGDFADAFHVVRRWTGTASGMTFTVDGNGSSTRTTRHARGDPRTVGLRPPVLHHPQPRGRR